MVDGRLEPLCDLQPKDYKYFIVVDFVTQKGCGKTITTVISKCWMGENEHYKELLKK